MDKLRDLNILKNFNILYLEDDTDLRTHTQDVLVDFVNNIYAVADSNSAYEIVQTQRVDAIISDILLEEENGIDFLRRLKEEKIEIPSIVTTAYTDTDYLLDAIRLKVENYIVKPINIKELLNSLYDILYPRVRENELRKQNNIIKTISLVTDNKQVDVIKLIMNNLDTRGCFISSYQEIMDQINISKPTLIKLFKQLLDEKILTKIDHKTYKFNQHNLDATTLV
ncbi:MAG: response regulator [Campylobacterota bacterium]